MLHFVTLIRSLLFYLCFFVWTALLSVFCLPVLLLPALFMRAIARLWGWGMVFFLFICTGIRFRVLGKEHIKHRDAVYLLISAHQSIWETAIFHIIPGRVSYVLKKELLSIPLFGWYLRKCKSIAIDRSAGASAMKRLIQGAKHSIKQRYHIVIFPEGTRVKPGETRRYQPGVAALYQHLADDVLAIPISLDSGDYWSSHRFCIYPGVITLHFHEPLRGKYEKQAFLAKLSEQINRRS